jgi:hypothetical protein
MADSSYAAEYLTTDWAFLAAGGGEREREGGGGGLDPLEVPFHDV